MTVVERNEHFYSIATRYKVHGEFELSEKCMVHSLPLYPHIVRISAYRFDFVAYSMFGSSVAFVEY